MAGHTEREHAPRSNDEASTPATATSNDIHVRYKLSHPTFRALCAIKSSPNRQDILRKACSAIEFRSFQIKATEKAFLREINDHTDIPYPIKEPISQPWHKAFLLVQIDLLKTGWPNKLSAAARKELMQERGRIFALFDRLLRCLADVCGERNDGKGVTTALDVLRSVKAGVWEGSEKQLLQVDGIGAKKMARLSDAGIKTIKQLSKLEFYHIERLLSRNPPFGQKLLHQLAGFPLLTMKFEVLGQHIQPLTPTSSEDNTSAQVLEEQTPMWIVRAVLGYENEKCPIWKERTPWTTLVIVGEDGRLAWFWRNNLKGLAGDKEMVIGLMVKKGEQLKVAFACEEIVGTILRETICI